LGLALLFQVKTAAQPYLNGDLTPNIAFNLRHSEASLSLKDNEDQIVILAFFTQWCRSCLTTLGTLATELEQRQNTNSNGLPIKLISVNLEPEGPELTDQFIMDLNLDVVIDDFGLDLWNTFSESNGIPLFVVLNGIKGSPSHREWEVVHKQLGTIEVDNFFAVLDSIQASEVTAPLNNPFAGVTPDPFGWREIPWFGRSMTPTFPGSITRTTSGSMSLDEALPPKSSLIRVPQDGSRSRLQTHPRFSTLPATLGCSLIRLQWVFGSSLISLQRNGSPFQPKERHSQAVAMASSIPTPSSPHQKSEAAAHPEMVFQL
jgi:hypothetical protein